MDTCLEWFCGFTEIGGFKPDCNKKKYMNQELHQLGTDNPISFYSLHAGKLFILMLSSADFTSGLAPDQDRHSVANDLDPKCLQRLSEYGKSYH